MQSTKEYGEFFPAKYSFFGYNETVAQEYFPLSQKEAQKKGWSWHEEDLSKEKYLGPTVDIPDRIDDVHDDICAKILICEASQKPYKIIPQELKFYREAKIPLPRKAPDQRHKDRMSMRNPQQIWKRQCAKCNAPIETTYAPDRPEIVYCESCYLSSVY
jgi:hypothetical protein